MQHALPIDRYARARAFVQGALAATLALGLAVTVTGARRPGDSPVGTHPAQAHVSDPLHLALSMLTTPAQREASARAARTASGTPGPVTPAWRCVIASTGPTGTTGRHKQPRRAWALCEQGTPSSSASHSEDSPVPAEDARRRGRAPTPPEAIARFAQAAN